MGSRPSAFSLTAPGPLRLYSTEELLKLPPPTWQINNILPEGALAVMYGAPECGKSFLAIDLALSVATGLPWLGQTTVPGYAVYVAAEGGAGIGKRVRAWLAHRGLTSTNLDVAWLIESMTVHRESDDVEQLMKRFDTEIAQTPSLIVLDTLARSLEGDENTQLDMGRFVAGVDMLRQEYGATILVIHHTRLDGERERGNTALRGGADTMLEVKREQDSGAITVSCAKQKDWEHFEPMDLMLTKVPDTDSCVVVSEQGVRLETLRQILRLRKTPMFSREIVDSALSHGMSRATVFRVLAETVKSGEIIKENGKYTLSQSHE